MWGNSTLSGGIIPGGPAQGAALDDLQSLGVSSADLIPEEEYIGSLAFRVDTYS